MSRITIFLLVFIVINITNAINFYSKKRKEPPAMNSKDVEIDQVPKELNIRQRLIEKSRKKIGIRTGNVTVCNGPPQDYVSFYYEVAIGKNGMPMDLPYEAQVIRTFLEKNVRDPFSKLYNFHLYGIKENESVRRAEIHVQVQVVRHTSISYPTCYIQVYQVLPNMSLDNPELHRLIMSRTSMAVNFLREPLEVTSLARSWVSGESPNLGVLIVTSCNPGFELLTRHRNDNEPEDQAMFVLFNNYNTDASNNQYNDSRKKRHIVEQHEGLGHVEVDEPAHYSHRKNFEFSPKRRQITSEEVYKILKERNKPKPSCDKKDELEVERTSSTESTGSRSKREISNLWLNGSYERYNTSIRPCDRHDMHIDFEELGIQLIGPKSYNAYQCLGHCKKQEYVSTVYSNIREIIYRRQKVEIRDCRCAPNKMTKIPVAYCDRKGQAVLRYLTNMVVTSCSCRNNDNE